MAVNSDTEAARLPVRRLIADLQSILDGYRREGAVRVEVKVSGVVLFVLNIPLPKEPR